MFPLGGEVGTGIEVELEGEVAVVVVAEATTLDAKREVGFALCIHE